MAHLFKSYASTKRAEEVFSQLDFSEVLRTPSSFAPTAIAPLGLPGEVSALACDPVQSLFALGTKSGTVHVWGGPAVQTTWRLKPITPVKNLAFHVGKGLLVVIGKAVLLTGPYKSTAKR
jgi:syntaxin-binding protein 5